MNSVSKPGALVLLMAAACSARATTVVMPHAAPWRTFGTSQVVALIDCHDDLPAGEVVTCSVLDAWKGLVTPTIAVTSRHGWPLGRGAEGQILLLQLAGNLDLPCEIGPMNALPTPAPARAVVEGYMARRVAMDRLPSDAERSRAFWSAILELARSNDPAPLRWLEGDMGTGSSPWGRPPEDIEPFVALALDARRGMRATLAAGIVLDAVTQAPNPENQAALADLLRGRPDVAAAFLRASNARGIPLAEPMLAWLRSVAAGPNAGNASEARSILSSSAE